MVTISGSERSSLHQSVIKKKANESVPAPGAAIVKLCQSGLEWEDGLNGASGVSLKYESQSTYRLPVYFTCRKYMHAPAADASTAVVKEE